MIQQHFFAKKNRFIKSARKPLPLDDVAAELLKESYIPLYLWRFVKCIFLHTVSAGREEITINHARQIMYLPCTAGSISTPNLAKAWTGRPVPCLKTFLFPLALYRFPVYACLPAGGML